MSEPQPGTGLLIAFEGIEGSGKSTQVALLGDWLRSLSLEVVAAREPGGTMLGEGVRALLLESAETASEVPARAELMLMLAARAALMEQIVEPALARGAIVLLDRFELSSFAYQGHGRGIPLAEVRAANAIVTRGRHPDLTLLLDVHEQTGAERRRAAARTDDRIEAAGRAFHERVARGYRELARNEHGVVVVDGTGEQSLVQERVRDELRRRFPETIGRAKG
ncbi:MAG TPA: dTMP kinase [Longimicrobiales bacterium]|nr:dTMP kinase [Longimicrobiales bacterium]